MTSIAGKGPNLWAQPMPTCACPHAKQDNVENEKLPSTIQVIDPSHPLFGLTFSSTNLITPIGRKWIYIKMSSGYRRAIPRSATSLDQPALELESVLKLPRLSVSLCFDSNK
jgi:hypothetical protein